jgi:hypothetical protein
MGAQSSSWSTLAIALVALVVTSCAKGPTLDEVLDEYARLRNEQTSVSCACPETIGAGMNFMTEQECLDASDPIDSDDLACMKQVLDSTSHDESKDIELMECYNEATAASIECKRTNLEICSTTASNDCVYAQENDFGACTGAYSSTLEQTLEATEALEALFGCTLS